MFFQVLLFALAPVARDELSAANLDPVFASYLNPAFLSARIWLAVTFAFLLFALKCCDFGSPPREAILPLAVFVAGCYLVALFGALQFPFCIDDAYIDFRHARNLVLHGSLDYNLGDPVMGFTSHLHYWILAAIGWLGGFDALPRNSQNFNILCDLLSFVLIFKLNRQLGLSPFAAVLGSVLLTLSSYAVRCTSYGKEANLLILLLLILFYCIETRRLNGVAWAATLVFLTRPEGVLLAGLVGVWCLVAHGWRAYKHWIVPGALATLWYAVLLLHFGTIWPNGMIAKSLVYQPLPLLLQARFILSFVLSSFGNALVAAHIAIAGQDYLLLLIPLMVLALGRAKSLRLYLATIVLITLVFIVKKVTLGPFPWYMAWYALLPALILPYAYQKTADQVHEPVIRGILTMASIIVGLCLIPLSTYPSVYAPLAGFSPSYPFFNWDRDNSRLLSYQAMAHRLQASTGMSSLVAVSEDGIFGYTYDGPILTLDGLTLRDCANYYPLPQKMHVVNFAISPKLVEDKKPDYVLLLEVFGRNSLLADPDFQKHYRLIDVSPSTTFGSKGLYLYQKLPIPVAARDKATPNN